MPKPSTREILEKALTEDQDDLAAHAAYADLLIQEGDPRGEFIQVQLELEDFDRSFDERRQLLARESELFRAHGCHWLGRLADFFLGEEPDPAVLLDEGGPYQIKFSHGWLHEVHVPVLSLHFAHALANSPLIRLLHRLVIDGLEFSDDYYDTAYVELTNDMRPAVEMLQQSPYLCNVRDFVFGREVCSQPGDLIVP